MQIIPVEFGGVDDIVDFVNIVSRFDCDVDLKCGSYIVDAKSIMGVFTLKSGRNLEMMIHEDNNKELIECVSRYL